MADITNIQWCDLTWNIARGCTKFDDGCLNCYMMRDGEKYGYNGKEVNRTTSVFELPLRYKGTSSIWKGPPLCFLSSLTDWLHPDIDPYRGEVFEIIRKRPDLIFLALTKRTGRLGQCLPGDWGSGYPNVWLGASAASQESYDSGRVTELLRAPARRHFLSLEPLIGPINLDFNDIENAFMPDCMGESDLDGRIDWVIVGGESGNDNGRWKYRPCKAEWILDIIQQCRSWGIPVFVKQLGTHLAKQLKLKDRHGGNINEWPEELRVRQMPTIPR